MPIRALIVDDEPLACERLRELLAFEPAVRVIGTCANGREALAAVQHDSPDVVFLDVRTPDMDGLSFLKALFHPAHERPTGCMPRMTALTLPSPIPRHLVPVTRGERVPKAGEGV